MMKFVWKTPPLPENKPIPTEQPSAGGAQAPNPGKERVKMGEMGADLKTYIEAFEKVDPTQKKEFLDKTQQWQQTEAVEDIRRAGVSKEDNEKDPNKKHILLSSLYLNRDKAMTEKMVFRVDFGGNDLAERRVGAGDLLPPTVKEIRVTTSGGQVLEGVRTINPTTGRIGYYEKSALENKNYNYIPVFSGDTIEILKTQNDQDSEMKRQVFREKMEVYDPPKRQTVLYGNYNQQELGSRQVAIPPRLEAAPNAGKMKIENQEFDMVDRNYWESIGSRRFLNHYDPTTNQPITFMGKEISSSLNLLMLPYLKEAEARMKATGIDYKIKDFQFFADRNIREGTQKSYHAYGVAGDINPGDNAFKQEWGTLDPTKRVPEKFVQVMESLGFVWGGRWGRPDPMHFEFHLNPFTSTALLQSAEAQKYKAAILDKTQQAPQQPAIAQQPKQAGQPQEMADSGTSFNKALNANIRGRMERFMPFIEQASQTYGVPKNLIMSVMMQESGGNPNIVSPAGAGGLMQIMPNTARGYGMKNIYDPVRVKNGGLELDPRDDRANPEKSIMTGAKILGELTRRYKGNVVLALAAYNAGPGKVDKWNGVPPIGETQKYVANIPRMYASLNAEDKNNPPAPPANPDKKVV